MSTHSEDADDVPHINSDTSKGSSVSSGMQDEYNELLKYAVVVPKWTSNEPNSSQVALPMLNLQQPEDIPLTTVDQCSSSSNSCSSNNLTTRSNDGHDSAMGSDEITTDRKTFREPLSELKESAPAPLTSTSTNKLNQMQTNQSNIDDDLSRMHEQLKIWNCKLNNMVLAEFSQAKMAVVEKYRKLLHDKEMDRQKETNKLQDEIENLKELLHTYETSLERKDTVILNLTRAVQNNKDKQEIMRALNLWKLRLNDERRINFTTTLAKKHRQQVLLSRTWQAWRALVEGNWREKVEKACQNKAREVCMQLTDSYEKKLESLNDVVSASRAEINRLNEEREKYEESMKKAFMRGVCALNLEAMSMFQNQEGSENQMETLSKAVDALSCNPNNKNFNSAQHQSRVQFAMQDCQHHNKPTTVYSRPSNSLPVTAAVNPNAEVILHTRSQIPSVPLQQVQIKCRPKSTSRNLLHFDCKTTTNKAKRATSKPSGNTQGSIIVKRHQPNIQNYTTGRPLKHVAKYPNTPIRPIAGK